MARVFEVKKIKDDSGKDHKFKAEITETVTTEKTMQVTLAQALEQRNAIIQQKIVLDKSYQVEKDRLQMEQDYLDTLISQMRDAGIIRPEEEDKKGEVVQ